MNLNFTIGISNIFADPVELVKLLGGLIAIFTAIFKFYKTGFHRIRIWRDRRTLRKRLGAELFTPENIFQATQNYIRPHCQYTDPGDDELTTSISTSRENLFEKVDEFLFSRKEKKYLILLADSGMGKTSFLLNYYARHWWSRRRREKFNIVIVPLGFRNAQERIKAIPDKEKTVLFLDAFDEDSHAILDYKSRLDNLLTESQEFQKILLTCRTQFFKSDEEIPQETGLIKVGVTKAGETREYLFQRLYVSPFTDEQVNLYLKQRFPLWIFQRRRQAKQIVKKIPDLSIRPMLLAHVQDLIKSGRSFRFTFELYEEIVDAWLERERPFVKNKEALRAFSEHLAVDLYVNREKRMSESVPRAELECLGKRWGINLDDWHLSARSLLNRDALGNCKFAHRSILEYLFVKRFIVADSRCFGILWTKIMKSFLWDMIQNYIVNSKKIPFDYTKADLDGFRFTFRSKPLDSRREEVLLMLQRFNFYDSHLKENGVGISNLLQVCERDGFELIVDHTTGLTWQHYHRDTMKIRNPDEYIWLINYHRLCGFGDWRLPTLEEAMSLMKPQKYNELHTNPVFTKAPSPANDHERMVDLNYQIVTSDKVIDDSTIGVNWAGANWIANFKEGCCTSGAVFVSNWVRAVRSGIVNP